MSSGSAAHAHPRSVVRSLLDARAAARWAPTADNVNQSEQLL